jgi:toxin ParE1/3/4
VVVLGDEATRDLVGIIRWTSANLGERQAEAYGAAIKALIGSLARGPAPVGSKVRDDIAAGLRTLHLRALGHRGRHFALYRACGTEIQVLRVLHDSMDLARHAPPPED